MVATVSLERSWARIICSTFLLCMVSKALEKSTNNSVASKCLAWISSMNRQIFITFDAVDRFPPKIILIFPKDFLSFWFDVIAKQSIIYLRRDRRRNYTSVVFGDSEVTFLSEGENAAFCSSLYSVLVIFGIAKSK